MQDPNNAPPVSQLNSQTEHHHLAPKNDHGDSPSTRDPIQLPTTASTTTSSQTQAPTSSPPPSLSGRTNSRPASQKRGRTSPDRVEGLSSVRSNMGTSIQNELPRQDDRVSELSSRSLPINSCWKPFIPYSTTVIQPTLPLHAPGPHLAAFSSSHNSCNSSQAEKKVCTPTSEPTRANSYPTLRLLKLKQRKQRRSYVLSKPQPQQRPR